jgi:hypothetical protein
VEAPKGEVSVGFRGGWVSHFKVALSSAGAAAVVLAAFELLQRQPGPGFTLLSQWGPWPILALAALIFMGRFLARLNDTIQISFSAVVTSSQQGAEAQAKQAEALSRLAEQGGKQFEEVRRLSIYAAQEIGGVYVRFDGMDAVLRDLAQSVKGLHTKLSNEKAALEKTEGTHEH